MKRAVMSDMEKEKQQASYLGVVKLVWTMGNVKSYVFLVECSSI